jgi:hypothetical protein
MDLKQIAFAIKANPKDYTVWFKIIFDRFYNYIKTKK